MSPERRHVFDTIQTLRERGIDAGGFYDGLAAVRLWWAAERGVMIVRMRPDQVEVVEPLLMAAGWTRKGDGWVRS